MSPNRVRPLLRAARDAKRITDAIGCALSAGVTGRNSPRHTNQPRKTKTDRVGVKYFFARAGARLYYGERAEETVFLAETGSAREKIQLFGSNYGSWLCGDAAEAIEQALDAVADCHRGMAAAEREFLTGSAFELELCEQFAFFRRKPSAALAIIEKLLQQDVRAGILDAHLRVRKRDPSSVRIVSQRGAGLANRPAICAATYLAGDGKGQVRAAGLEFARGEKFEQSGKQVLGRIIAGKRGKGDGYLGSGAVDRWNEGQQQESLSHRMQ